jgi:hypothetical protein
MCYYLFLTTLQLFWYFNAYAFSAVQIFPERMTDNITTSEGCQEVLQTNFPGF